MMITNEERDSNTKLALSEDQKEYANIYNFEQLIQ